MASARQDFESFVRWLFQAENGAPDNVLRLATLALQNFDALSATSR